MKLDKYKCEGQLSIFDAPRPVTIKGICDDAYCPECNYGFMETKELDCDRCPVCGIRVNWTPWHRLNDNEEANNDSIT